MSGLFYAEGLGIYIARSYLLFCVVASFDFFFFCTCSYRLQIILNLSICHIDKILIGISIPGQFGPGSNSSERILHTSQISKNGDSPSDAV